MEVRRDFVTGGEIGSRPLRRDLAGSKTLADLQPSRIGAALFWLLACGPSVHESSSFSRVANVFRVLCTGYIRSQAGSGWSPRVLSRSRRPKRTGSVVATRVPNIVFHVSRADSTARRRLSSDRARLARLRIHGGSGGTGIRLFVRRTGRDAECIHASPENQTLRTVCIRLRRTDGIPFGHGSPGSSLSDRFTERECL